MKTLLAGVACIALAACGGSISRVGCSASTDPADCIVVPGVPDARARINEYSATLDRLSGINRTAFAAVPEGGSARFTGVGSVIVDPQFAANPVTGAPVLIGTSATFAGDATIVVGFAGNGSVTGGVTNILGEVNGGTLREYDGTISFSNESVGATRPNALTAD